MKKEEIKPSNIALAVPKPIEIKKEEDKLSKIEKTVSEPI